MGRPVSTTTDTDLAAVELLVEARRLGVQFKVTGDTVKYRGDLPPDLREALRRRHDELVRLLTDDVELVTLRGGVSVPADAFRLGWRLQDAGFVLAVDETGVLSVRPESRLTGTDRAEIQRRANDLARVVRYFDGLPAN